MSYRARTDLPGAATAAQAAAIQRANHTGTQTLATISDAGTAASHAHGDYATAAQGITADTGWTANSGVGDKTAVLTDYVAGIDGTMISALNIVSAGLGTSIGGLDAMVVLLRKKVQALETALAASKRPNA